MGNTEIENIRNGENRNEKKDIYDLSCCCGQVQSLLVARIIVKRILRKLQLHIHSQRDG